MLDLTFEFTVQEKDDETTYSVIVDEGYKGREGLVRVFIPRYFEETKDPDLSHEFYLNSEECHALGKHLLAVSERLRISEKTDN
jgi:hypothetical protein